MVISELVGGYKFLLLVKYYLGNGLMINYIIMVLFFSIKGFG